MALSADDRLVLIRIKTERAKKNLIDLQSELLPFWNRKETVPIFDDQPGARNRPPNTKTLPVYPFSALAIAGDIVHNLRSALDHLAYQLVLVGSGGPPNRLVEFPIAKDRGTYEAEKSRKVHGIGPEAVKHIDGLKPYKGGNDALWRIHELNNIDKHRFVFTISDDALFVAPWYTGPDDAPHMPFLLRPRTLKTDAPLFAAAFEAEMDYDLNFQIAEATAKPQVGQGNTLFESLQKWILEVEAVIFSFRPFLG